MTYPPSSSGYPPSQQPTTQFSAPTQQFGKVEQPSHAPAPSSAAPGPSKLPFILLAVIAVLGLLVYLFSFGPQFKIESTDFPQLGSATGTSMGLGLAVVASLLSALIAAASLLPRQKAPVGIIAAVAVLAFLLVLAEIIQAPDGVSLGWGLYVVIFLTFVQAALAIGALLLDAGVLSAPVPKPKYEKAQYGQYGAPNQYYGQHAPHQGGPQQRPPYPGQYGGGYSGGAPSGSGYAAIGQHGGPPTPPTGFPTYGQPQASPSAPTGQVPAQPQSEPHSSSSSSSSNQSGNSPS